MASTPRGRELTEQHRQAQLSTRAEFLAQFLVLWALLDSAQLDATGPGWVTAVMGLIRPFRRRSAELSTNYFLEFRDAELVTPARPRTTPRPSPRPRTDRPTPLPRTPRPEPQQTTISDAPPRESRRTRFDISQVPTFDDAPRRTRFELPELDWTEPDKAAETSLIVTGPVSQKSKSARGKPLQQARDESLVEAGGAASRHVLTGGRQSLLTLLEQDPEAVGWIRVTDGDPCAFCAMLSSRGIVYSSQGTAGFRAHDNCACTAEPAYSRNAPWPGKAAEYRRLWREVVGDAPNNRYSGQDAINAFRRAYEQRQRDARREVA